MELKEPPSYWNSAIANIPEPIRVYAVGAAMKRYNQVFADKTSDNMIEMDVYLRKNASETTGLCVLLNVTQNIESAGLRGMPDRSFKKFLPAMEAAGDDNSALDALFTQLQPMMRKRWAILSKNNAGGKKEPEANVDDKPKVKKRRKTNARAILDTPKEEGRYKPGGLF